MWKALAALALLLLGPLGAGAQTAGPNFSLPLTSASSNVQLTGNTQIYPFVLISYAESAAASGVEAFISLGASSGTAATTTSQAVPAGGVCQSVGANSWVAGITGTSTTTLRVTQYTSCPTLAKLNVGSGVTPPIPSFPTTLGPGWAMAGQTNLTLPTSASLQTCCSMSWIFRVSTTQSTTINSIIGNESAANNSGVALFSNGTLIQFNTAPGGNFSCGLRACANTSLINDGTPHTLIATYNAGSSNNAGTLQLWIDGAPVGTTGSPTEFAPTTLPYKIFSGFTGQVYLAGFYSRRALTQADVTAWQTDITNNTLPSYTDPLTAGLVGYWTGPIVGGTSIPNLTGNDVSALIFDTQPVVAMTAPTNGATLTGNATLAATASNVGLPIQTVTFQVDTNTVCTATQTSSPYSCVYNTALSVDGVHSITATAADTNGLTTVSAAISVTTSNGTTPKTYYFAAAGSNSNTCLVISLPCQTIAKAQSIIASVGVGESDSFLFNGGDSFSGCFSLTSANTHSAAAYPAIFGSYGTGRPTVTQNCAFAGLSGLYLLNGVNGVIIQNQNLLGATPISASTRAGIYITNTTNTQAGNITVQNMQISGFSGVHGSGGTCADFGAHVMVDGAENPSGLINITVQDNILFGASVNGNDDNGIDGFGNSSNIINATYQGNDVHYLGGTAGCNLVGNGVLFDGTTNGNAFFDLVHDQGGNNTTCGAAAGQWTSSVIGVLIKFGEVYSMQPNDNPGSCDGDGYDADIASQDAIFEYVYSHDNEGISFASFVSAPWGGNQFRYSVAEHDTLLHGDGVGCITMQQPSIAFIYYAFNNVCWLDTPAVATGGLRPGDISICCGINAQTTVTGAIANNFFGITENDQGVVLFFQNNGNGSPFPNLQFKSNWWYNITGAGGTRWNWGGFKASLGAWQAVAPGGDTSAGTTTPNFTSPGGDQTCSWTPATITTWPPSGCPTGYVLQNTSPLLAIGVDMMATFGIDPGARDYYANAIPYSGNVFNTGADGGNP